MGRYILAPCEGTGDHLPDRFRRVLHNSSARMASDTSVPTTSVAATFRGSRTAEVATEARSRPSDDCFWFGPAHPVRFHLAAGKIAVTGITAQGDPYCTYHVRFNRFLSFKTEHHPFACTRASSRQRRKHLNQTVGGPPAMNWLRAAVPRQPVADAITQPVARRCRWKKIVLQMIRGP